MDGRGRAGCGPLGSPTGHTPEGFLYGPHSRMGALRGTQVDTVFIASGATHVLNHPSAVAESYADVAERYGIGGEWEAAALGHFPGYCPSLTRTASGAVVATTRFPYFSAHLSHDGGRTWEPPVIVDYCVWANQQAFEVEPDVVLVTFMGPISEPGQADSRIARLRVTEQGLGLDHSRSFA